MKKLVLGLLTFIMCCTLALIVMPSTAFAADGETENYNLWVGGTRVTSASMSGAGWSYEGDSSKGTLTLTNAAITGSYNYSSLSSKKASIYAKDLELTIKLVGTNTISAGDKTNTDGIRTNKNLTVTGDGSLEINTAENGIYSKSPVFDNTNVKIKNSSRCIHADGATDVVIKGGKVELTDSEDGMICGLLNTSNKAELTVKTGSKGLETDRAEISDSLLTLETEGDSAFYADEGPVIIKNSEVSAKTTGDDAVKCYSEGCRLEIIGSKVAATTESSSGYAIAAGSITIKDGSGSIKTYVEAKTSSSNAPAIFAETADGITLDKCLDIKTPEGGSVGSCVSYDTTGTSINDQNGNKAAHVIIQHHDLKLTKGVAATCTKPGAKDYYTCSVCGKYFSDENGSNEISKDSWILPALGPGAHKWDAGKVTKEASETAEGVKSFTCSICGQTKTEAIPKTVPKTKPQPAVKVSGMLLAKITAKGKKSLVLTWTRIKGAEGYDIFFITCNKKTPKKVRTIKGNKTFKWTKTGLKKKTAYKAVVKAYVRKNGRKTYVRTSPMVHAYTSGGTKKYTNSRSVTVKKTSLSLKAGKTYKIKASVNKLRKDRILMSTGHAAKLRYVSSNKKISTVSKSGKITARAKGSCKIYVIAVNGAYKAITVRVK